MSTQALRTTATRVAAPAMTLAECLAAIGVTVTDSSKVADMMLAAEYNLHPKTPRADIDRHIGNGGQHFFPSWELFGYDTYCALDNIMDYGGEPPAGIADKVDKIRESMPDAEIRVHAVPEDPFVEVRLGTESCWLGGWSYFFNTATY